MRDTTRTAPQETIIRLPTPKGEHKLTLSHQTRSYRYEHSGYRGTLSGDLNLTEGGRLEDIRRALPPNLRFMPPPQDKPNGPEERG